MTRRVPSPTGWRRFPRLSRRTLLKAVAGAATLAAPRAIAQAPARVVVVGGGFAGASCARALRQRNAALAITLIEPAVSYSACPRSNEVVAGSRAMEKQQFGYAGLANEGISVVPERVTAVDAGAKRVGTADGGSLPYDRLVIAPGIDLRFDAIPGYDEAAAEILPHAWKAGSQTLLLRRQLEAMDDGGLVVIAAPTNPFRCPPGPYERASLIARYLKTRKPRSKLLVLDAKDAFSKQRLFEAAWEALYPGLVEWVPLSMGGGVVQVDAASRTPITDFGEHRAAVANVIPPQRAGAVATVAGVADDTGWCPIDPVTFESLLQPGIHVIGDAAIGGAMPKSAFAANAQAKACAAAIAALLADRPPTPPKLVNTCYSLVAPDEAISIAGVYEPRDGLLTEVEGAGGTSRLDAPPSVRAAEARYAAAWFAEITREAFG